MAIEVKNDANSLFSFRVPQCKSHAFFISMFLSINCRSIYWTSARCCHIARIKKRSCPFLFFVSVVVALSIISHVFTSYACLVERTRCQVACGSHLAPMHDPNGSFCVHAMQLPTSSSTPLSDDDLLDLPELVTINQSELLVHLHKSSLAASISETGRENAATQASELVKPLKQLRSIGTQTEEVRTGRDWFCDPISETDGDPFPPEIPADFRG